jgi:hypothetical protein
MNLRRYIVLVVATMLAVGAWAQNATSSPSSRFGYGELNNNLPGAYRAMGGVGVGMRSNKVINPAQPASYTACDSLTFMFDIAGSLLYTNYGDANGTTNRMNGNLEYMTLQFPLWRRYIAMSVGVNPYSAVGYKFALNDSLKQDDPTLPGDEYVYHHTKAYSGEGGFTQVYGGLSFNICDWVALGANIYYMFGDVTQRRSLHFTNAALDSVSQVDNLNANSLRLRYGMQVFHTFGKHTINVGAVYEHKQAFSRMSYELLETTTNDTVATMSGGFEMPMMYGVGLSYDYANRLLVGVDYQFQDWAHASYFGEDKGLNSRHRWAVGLEYRNDPTSRKYVDRMLWRVGANYATSYTSSYNQPELGVSLGVGLPLRTTGTVINTTLEYGRRGGSNVLTENYLRLVISASISEHWFFKRKL